jgi:hypothetical protein
MTYNKKHLVSYTTPITNKRGKAHYKNMKFFGFTNDEYKQYKIHGHGHTTKVIDNATIPEVWERVKKAVNRVSDDNLDKETQLLCLLDKALISWWGGYVVKKDQQLSFDNDKYNCSHVDDKYGNTIFELKIHLKSN